MAAIRRLVLDVLKPHEPDIISLAETLAELEGVDAVNVALFEIDLKVENAKVTVEGHDIDFPRVRAVIKELGGAVHSIDEVVAGSKIIDASLTPQD